MNPLLLESLIVLNSSFFLRICAFASLFLRKNSWKRFAGPKRRHMFKTFDTVAKLPLEKLNQFRLPLAVYQNVCFFQPMLSLNFVTHFHICQCNRLKIKSHLICISLKLNIFSSSVNYLLLS